MKKITVIGLVIFLVSACIFMISAATLIHGDQIRDGTVAGAKLVGGTGSATVDVTSIAADGIGTLTITVTGAVAGDSVFVGAPSGIDAGLIWAGYVSAANTVTVRIYNTTAGAIDPASATWKAIVVR